jgi:hypothetical protein
MRGRRCITGKCHFSAQTTGQTPTKICSQAGGEHVDRMTETEWPIGMWPNHILGKIGMRPNLFWAPNETESYLSINRKETEFVLGPGMRPNHVLNKIGKRPNHVFSKIGKRPNHLFATIGTRPMRPNYILRYLYSFTEGRNRKDDWTLQSRSWQEMQLLLEEIFTLAKKYQCNEMRLWYCYMLTKKLARFDTHKVY